MTPIKPAKHTTYRGLAAVSMSCLELDPANESREVEDEGKSWDVEDEGKSWDVEDSISDMQVLGKGRWLCVIPRRWKRVVLKEYLRGADTLDFVAQLPKKSERLKSYDFLLVWGRQTVVNPSLMLDNSQLRLVTVEDGFLASSGLGISGAFYYSLLFDYRGVHYDASSPSDLEVALQTQQFSEQEKIKAQELIDFLVTKKVTKCNLVLSESLDINTEKKIILAIGQVEDDKSIVYGSPTIKTNLALIKQVRQSNPNAFVVFKPHPNYLKKGFFNRRNQQEFLKYCDEIIYHADICDCIELADEVHTISSTTGFEALLRGVKVVVYGMPFYAGWGLTKDCIALPRRQRTLELWQLVSVALISYPHYFNWQTGQFDEPINVVKLMHDISRGACEQAFYEPKLLAKQKKIMQGKEYATKLLNLVSPIAKWFERRSL